MGQKEEAQVIGVKVESSQEIICSVFRQVERRGQRFHAEVVRVEEKVVIKEEKKIGLLFPLGAEC